MGLIISSARRAYQALKGYSSSLTSSVKHFFKGNKKVLEGLKQEPRSQQYYDDLASVWNSPEGATYVSHKTGNIVHTLGYSGGAHYEVSLYKPSRWLTPEQTVQKGKKIFQIQDDVSGYSGLRQYDRFLAHGNQDANWLSTYNAQRRYWTPERGWHLRDGFVNYGQETTWFKQSEILFGKRVNV